MSHLQQQRARLRVAPNCRPVQWRAPLQIGTQSSAGFVPPVKTIDVKFSLDPSTASSTGPATDATSRADRSAERCGELHASRLSVRQALERIHAQEQVEGVSIAFVHWRFNFLGCSCPQSDFCAPLCPQAAAEIVSAEP